MTSYDEDPEDPGLRAVQELNAVVDPVRLYHDYFKLVWLRHLQVFDKSLLRRIEELSSPPDSDRKGILFALDGLLRDAKTRLAYQ